MRSFVALSAVLVATCASASSVTTVPLTKLQRTGAYLKGSADADRARAAFLKGRTANGPTTVPATNLAYVQYTTSVGIGNPPTYYNLVVDTGSSNTFCGSGISYVRTSTSISTGQAVNVNYGSGNFTGLEYLDQVTIAPNLVIANQSIGDALYSSGFGGIDGIIGVGPVDLTNNTLKPDVNTTIPTVMNNLVSQGLIENQVLGVYFAPSTNYSDTNGALTYGGIDPCLFEGELMYIPLTKTYPAAYYWGVNVTLSTYGTTTIIPTSTAGIVDTGTTLVLLADDYFDVYMDAIPGAKFNSSLGLIEIPSSSVPQMYPLDFVFADQVLVMDVAAQLIPPYQVTGQSGPTETQYGMVSKLGNHSGRGFDFIIGQMFMERYYAVFDADASRVGFAQTNNTFTITTE